MEEKRYKKPKTKITKSKSVVVMGKKAACSGSSTHVVTPL